LGGHKRCVTHILDIFEQILFYSIFSRFILFLNLKLLHKYLPLLSQDPLEISLPSFLKA
jgi:hypothetical protein